MTIEFSLPDIGEGLNEAEIVRWLVAEGQEVARNQPFVEILTDKSNVEMPAPAAGVVSRLVPAEGDIVEVGDLLIVIDDGAEHQGGPGAAAPGRAGATDSPTATATATGHGTATQSPVTQAAERPHDSAPAAPPPRLPAPGRRPKASPSTRRLAAELGVELGSLVGTGPGDRVLADDVTAAAEAIAAAPPQTTGPTGATGGPGAPPVPPSGPSSGPAPGAATTGPSLGWMDPGVHRLRGIRRATALAMDRSWSTIPHISASQEIDASPLLEARRQLREASSAEAEGPPITPLALVVMAVARALRRHPIMNAAIDMEAETITVPDRVNIGIAVATEHGLFVPVIADADRLGLAAVAAEIHRLSSAARARTIGAQDLSGGTHTITNYGSAGGHLATPIIRPGEAAITGLGGIAERPMVIEGEVVGRPTLPVVVCSDHRLIDGDVMSAFHLDVCRTLSAPIGLLL